MTDWTSTLNVEQAAAALAHARRLVAITHAKPDGDAIGSTLAVVRTALHLGAHAEAWYVGPMPRWSRTVIGTTPSRVFEPGRPVGVPTDFEPGTVFVVDTGTWAQVQEYRPFLAPQRERIVVVDHHVHGDVEVSAHRHLDTSAASCTQILAKICATALQRPVHQLPLDIAEPLFLGLATDTGWFRFSSVSPAVMRLAADLLDAGVDQPRLYQVIEQQDVLGRFRLMGRALCSVSEHRLLNDPRSRVAIMTLTQQDLDQSGADRNDAGGFSDILLSVANIQAAATLIEQADGPEKTIVKASVRSKPGPGAIDVAAAMARLGGGGHVRAAGAKVAGPLSQATRTILEALGASTTPETSR